MEHTTPTLEKALALAVGAHAGQTRKFSGEPYVTHPLRVARYLHAAGGDEDLLVAALLHDVVEDSEVTLADLRGLDFSPKTVALVDAVTRTADESYWVFLARTAAAGADARMLKAADIADNLATLPDGHGLRKRYEEALEILENGGYYGPASRFRHRLP